MNKQTFLWGSIPSEWTIQNLNELTTYISRGKQPKYVDYSEIRALNQKAIRWGFIDNSVLKYHNPEVKVDEKHFIKKGDVVINSTGTGTVGRTYYFGYSPEQIFADSHVTLVRTNSEVLNPQFLMYQLSTKAYQHFIEGSFLAGSTGQVEFNKSKVQQLPILLPTISEQNSIVNILSSLDEKIELNNQMNETLEEMAQALFKRWFVDFEFPNEEGQPYKSSGGEMVESELGMIPKGWTYKKIIDLPLSVTDYVANGSFASLKANVTIFETIEYALFVRNTDIKDNFKSSKRYVNEHSYNFLSKTKLYGGEVLISNVGDVGSVYLCPHLDIPMTLGNNMIMINSIGGEDLNLYLYRLFRSREGQGLIQSITSGSVQLKFNKTQFRNLSILIPTKQLLEQYVELQKSIENMKFHNIKENEQLIRYRDTLLPKLMSGEVRVSDFES